MSKFRKSKAAQFLWEGWDEAEIFSEDQRKQLRVVYPKKNHEKVLTYAMDFIIQTYIYIFLFSF